MLIAHASEHIESSSGYSAIRALGRPDDLGRAGLEGDRRDPADHFEAV